MPHVPTRADAVPGVSAHAQSRHKRPWYRRLLPFRGSPAPAHPDLLLDRLSAAARAGEFGQTPYDPRDALHFPLGERCFDEGLRYLFDFAVAADGLGLRPSSTVLDFASGMGWSTELLNRFGFETVTLDIDVALLSLGRQRLRLDRRCTPERVHPVAGNGAALPFADASFDGILCLNALHHMPDYGPVFTEMCRVLRPGGRAAFSEPGSMHSAHPTSRMCMEQHGVLERDVVAADVYRLATAAGFTRMVLKPYHYPAEVVLDFNDKQPTLRQRLRLLRSALAERAALMRYVEERHLLFYLEKGQDGGGPPRPRVLAAGIEILQSPARAVSGSSLTVVARCRNRGDTAWPVAPTRWSAPVSLGVKVLDRHGALVDDHRGRTALARDVQPGEQVDIVASISLEGLPPGSYRLLFDMVSEHVCWFQAVGSLPVERSLEVM